MMKSEKKTISRIGWIDVLRGIGIIIVVFGHIYNQNKYMHDWIYSFHLALFFWAAGFVYKERDIVVDIRRRFETIMIPYFVFAFLSALYYFALESRLRDGGVLRSRYL